jgi:FkbM family methyltransferase
VALIRARERLAGTGDKLFCDLGFNNRLVFNQFYDALGADFRWCGLELQQPLYQDALSDFARYAQNPVDFGYAAAATRDGDIEMALDGKDDAHHPNDGSTTVLSIARDQSSARRRTVPCVDLAHYLADRSSPDTRIVLKMDVEGAEYDLLPHLLESPVMERLEIVFCEFHWRRFPWPGNVSRLFLTEEMIDKFGKRGCSLLSWR